jgi:hypothetical protein
MMHDPHVERLHFRIEHNERTVYEKPEPIHVQNEIGTFETVNGDLVVSPGQHYASVPDARTVVEPFLRAWECHADLDDGIGVIRFKYFRADVLDRDPKPGSVAVALGTTEVIGTADRVIAQMARTVYPAPPVNFAVSPDLETCLLRWKRYREGREPLQSMAYFVYTYVTAFLGGGDVKAVSEHLSVSRPVLDKIRILASTKGDASTARKVNAKAPFVELTSAEEGWLDQAVGQVIRRIGEVASGAKVPLITMADLPSPGAARQTFDSHGRE